MVSWFLALILMPHIFFALFAQEIPLAECGVLTDAAIENSTLLEFSLAANEATPEMVYRRPHGRKMRKVPATFSMGLSENVLFPNCSPIWRDMETSFLIKRWYCGWQKSCTTKRMVETL